MSNQDTTKTSLTVPPLPSSKHQKLSDTSGSSPVLVPTPGGSPEPGDISLEHSVNMENSQDNVQSEAVESAAEQQETLPVPQAVIDAAEVIIASRARSEKVRKARRQSKKSKREDAESTSDDSDADSESEDSSDSDKKKRRKKQKLATKKAAAKKAKKSKSKSKSKKSETSDDSSDSSFDSSSDDEKKKRKKRHRKAIKTKAAKKSKKVNSSSDDDKSSSSNSSTSDSDSEDEKSKEKSKRKRKGNKKKKSKATKDSSFSTDSSSDDDTSPSSTETPPPPPPEDINTQVENVSALLQHLKLKQLAEASSNAADAVIPPPPPPKVLTKKNALEFKRIDQVWDVSLRDYKLVESSADQKDEFDCVFTVRRKFDWDGRHKETQVDIKSKVLRNALQVVFKECKGISLVEEVPQLDPHTLFHYYDEIHTYVRKTLKPKLKRAKRTKKRKLLTQEIAQCKLLLGYVDEDYAATRRALKPMLKAGTITYDLCWALFRPNTIAYTPTYGNKDDPRCFKVDVTYEYESWLTGAKSWVVDGRYLEYDGKVFGLGDHQVQISAFKGHKKITNLAAYPLEYHQDPKVSRDFLVRRDRSETQTDRT